MISAAFCEFPLRRSPTALVNCSRVAHGRTDGRGGGNILFSVSERSGRTEKKKKTKKKKIEAGGGRRCGRGGWLKARRGRGQHAPVHFQPCTGPDRLGPDPRVRLVCRSAFKW